MPTPAIAAAVSSHKGVIMRAVRFARSARFLVAVIFAVLAIPAHAADPGDEYWTPPYPPAGFTGSVRAMLSHSGVLYVGGTFTAIQGESVPYVAALGTSTPPGPVITSVDPVGDGLNGYVYDFCEYGGDLVAVGLFTLSGEQTMEHVGRWDGAAWHALGDGLPGQRPRAAVSYQGDLYVGAMRWDGATWENVLQTDADVTSLAVHDGLLYAGGAFTHAQGDSIPYLLAWDGTQIVNPDPGFPLPVDAMVNVPDGLYVAGSDPYYGNGLLSRWDGAAWTDQITGPTIQKLATLGGDVVAAVIVPTYPHQVDRVLQTNAGGAWHTVADVCPYAMTEHDGELLVQANAGEDATLLTPGLAAFDGAYLHDVFSPPSGCSTGFRTVAPFGANVIVGGYYTIAGGLRFEGSALNLGNLWYAAGAWSDLATSFPATFERFQSVGANVFAVYSWIDWDVEVQGLARLVWDVDRYRWQDVAYTGYYPGLLQTVGTQLFNIGDGELRLIDPTTGAIATVGPLAADAGIYGTCDAGGHLVVGGDFSTLNGQAVGNVARYVDGVWEGVGDPLPGLRVQAVTGLEGDQVAASTSAGGGVYRVWMFDGASWSQLPGDFKGSVGHLVYHRGRLFAAGSFDRVGPVWAPGVAVWTGDQWAPVGSGLRGNSYDRVTDVLSQGDKLVFVGSFTWAGGRPSTGYAEWTGDPTLFTGAPSGVPDAPTGGRLLEDPRPNPFNPRTEIVFTVPTAGPVAVGIYDLRGRCVRRLVDDLLAAGRHVRRWDGRDDAGRAMPSGVYFARMDAAGRTESVKLTLVR